MEQEWFERTARSEQAEQDERCDRQAGHEREPDQQDRGAAEHAR